MDIMGHHDKERRYLYTENVLDYTLKVINLKKTYHICAETGILLRELVNTMMIDNSQAPCVTRVSATMLLEMQDEHVPVSVREIYDRKQKQMYFHISSYKTHMTEVRYLQNVVYIFAQLHSCW